MTQPVRFLQPQIAAGVVRVVVRVEDVREAPAPALELAVDDPGVGRVDGGGEAGQALVDQEPVVVRQAGELVDLQQGHFRRRLVAQVSLKRGLSSARLQGRVRASSWASISLSQPVATALREPGRQNTKVPLASPARQRDCSVDVPMSS